MKIKLKEALLGTALAGGIFNCLLLPSYGMEDELSDGKEKNKSLGRSAYFRSLQSEGLSPSRIERKMKQRDQKECAEIRTASLQSSQNARSQAIEFWLNTAKKGNLAALYNVGWLLHQKSEKDASFLEEERKSRDVIGVNRGKGFLSDLGIYADGT